MEAEPVLEQGCGFFQCVVKFFLALAIMALVGFLVDKKMKGKTCCGGPCKKKEEEEECVEKNKERKEKLGSILNNVEGLDEESGEEETKIMGEKTEPLTEEKHKEWMGEMEKYNVDPVQKSSSPMDFKNNLKKRQMEKEDDEEAEKEDLKVDFEENDSEVYDVNDSPKKYEEDYEEEPVPNEGDSDENSAIESHFTEVGEDDDM